MIKSYLKQSELYILYIHPFELSIKPNPPFPEETKWYNQMRFSAGRSTVSEKLFVDVTEIQSELDEKGVEELVDRKYDLGNT